MATETDRTGLGPVEILLREKLAEKRALHASPPEQTDQPRGLTERMRTHLEVLLQGERSAYPGLNLKTLDALGRRGLIRSRAGSGAIFSPQTAIRWRITDAGRLALQQKDTAP